MLQGSIKHDGWPDSNLSVQDFITNTLPLLEMEKNAEVAQVHPCTLHKGLACVRFHAASFPSIVCLPCTARQLLWLHCTANQSFANVSEAVTTYTAMRMSQASLRLSVNQQKARSCHQQVFCSVLFLWHFTLCTVFCFHSPTTTRACRPVDYHH